MMYLGHSRDDTRTRFCTSIIIWCVFSFFHPARRSLRRRHLQLCGPAGSSGAQLRGVSRPGGEGHPQRKTPAHARVPGGHSRHEAPAVSLCVCLCSFSFVSLFVFTSVLLLSIVYSLMFMLQYKEFPSNNVEPFFNDYLDVTINQQTKISYGKQYRNCPI